MFVGLASCDLGEDEELMGSDYLKTRNAKNPKKYERGISLKLKRPSIHAIEASFVGKVLSAKPKTPPISETAPPISKTENRR